MMRNGPEHPSRQSVSQNMMHVVGRCVGAGKRSAIVHTEDWLLTFMCTLQIFDVTEQNVCIRSFGFVRRIGT